MKKLIKNWPLWAAIAFAVIVCLAMGQGCATDNYMRNAYRGLSTAATTYETSMAAIADMHKRGIISDEKKDKTIEIGEKYWAAYHAAVDALAAYEKTKRVEDKEKVDKAIEEVSALLADFAFYAEPFLKGGE